LGKEGLGGMLKRNHRGKKIQPLWGTGGRGMQEFGVFDQAVTLLGERQREPKQWESGIRMPISREDTWIGKNHIG